MSKGIVVAATQHIEWLLPWWWINYKAHNNLPVAFFDLGLTEKAKAWCKERGTLISLTVPDSLVFGKEKVEPLLADKWEKVIGSGVWDIRLKWFKKPFVFTESPFLKAIWIDLDCEVKTPLDALFPLSDNEAGLCIGKEPEAFQKGFRSLELTLPDEITYNSGVVIYKKDAPILNKWKEEVLTRNHFYISDQEALSRVLFLDKTNFTKLPREYNWDRGLGPNPNALIFHWHGQKGKQLILEQIQALSSLGLSDFGELL